MSGDWREDGQVQLLLRVGLGAVWVYQGLVPLLLGPTPDLPSHLGRQALPAWSDGGLWLAMGGFEVLLGLCLILGWVVPWAAAVQTALLLGFTVDVARASPHLLTDPSGAISKNLALCAAGLCLWILGRSGAQPRATRLAWAVPLILRAGLGLMWLYEGLVPKWLWPSSAEVEIVASTGMIPLHIPLFLRLLGLIEAALGLTVLLGLRVREFAVLQAGLLGAFTAIVGWTSPASLADPFGSVSKNLALMGSALALYRLGGGPLSLGAWLARTPRWRGWMLHACLQANRAVEIGAAEAYRVQAQAARDPTTEELFHKLALDEAHHGEDLASLIRRQGGRPLPVGPVCTGVAWVVGCATALCGVRASLRFDLWAEERGEDLYARCAGLLPPEAGITGRALQAMQSQEEQHVRLLRDHLRARRAADRRRR